MSQNVSVTSIIKFSAISYKIYSYIYIYIYIYIHVPLKMYSIKGLHVLIPLNLSEGVYVTSFRVFDLETGVQKEVFVLLR